MFATQAFTIVCSANQPHIIQNIYLSQQNIDSVAGKLFSPYIPAPFPATASQMPFTAECLLPVLPSSTFKS